MKLFNIFLIILILTSISFAEETLSDQAIEAGKELDIAYTGLQELIDDNFNTIRYNDILLAANQTYEAQLVLENKTGEADYSLIHEKTEELRQIKSNAYTALDEITTLEATIAQVENIDTTPILELYNQTKEAFDSERYQESIELVETTYNKISELEAIDTKLRAFSEAISKSITQIIKKWWWLIIIIIAGFITLFTLTYDKAIIYILKNKIKGLEIRKNSIKKLIARTQKEYFDKGTMNEMSYRTRTNKYAELIRDINRQIPLLNEKIYLRMKKSKKVKHHAKKQKRYE